MLEATYRARSASKTRYFAGLFRRACCLPLARPSRDDRRCHRDLVILAPGRPDGPPQLEEVGIEDLDAHFLQLRRSIGSPWGKDHKVAMAAAIVAARAR